MRAIVYNETRAWDEMSLQDFGKTAFKLYLTAQGIEDEFQFNAPTQQIMGNSATYS